MGSSLTLVKTGSEAADTVIKSLTSIGEIAGEGFDNCISGFASSFN